MPIPRRSTFLVITHLSRFNNFFLSLTGFQIGAVLGLEGRVRTCLLRKYKGAPSDTRKDRNPRHRYRRGTPRVCQRKHQA